MLGCGLCPGHGRACSCSAAVNSDETTQMLRIQTTANAIKLMPATHFCGATVQTHYRADPRPPWATYVQTVCTAHLHFVLVEQQVGNSLLDKEAAAIQWTHQCAFLQAHLQVEEQQIKSVVRQIFDRSRCPHVQSF